MAAKLCSQKLQSGTPEGRPKSTQASLPGFGQTSPRHGCSSPLISLRHPYLARIPRSSLSLSLLRSDLTTLVEHPYRGALRTSRGARGPAGHRRGTLLQGYVVSRTLPCRLAFSSKPCCHSERCVAGAICTAVTLYSGQLVAQSLCSVVTTFAPVSGLWNVV